LRIVLGNAGRRDQCRFAAGGRRFGTAFEQEFRQRPVGGAAGGGERTDAFVIERIRRGAGIEQHGGDAGFAAQRGTVQRRAAFGIGGARTGTVGEQGEHRLRASMPIVAGGGQQRGRSAADAIDLRALGDQRTQQAGIGQQRGEHQHRTLIAIARAWRGIGIGAGVEQYQRALDVAGAGGGQQRGGLLRRAGDAFRCTQGSRRWCGR